MVLDGCDVSLTGAFEADAWGGASGGHIVVVQRGIATIAGDLNAQGSEGEIMVRHAAWPVPPDGGYCSSGGAACVAGEDCGTGQCRPFASPGGLIAVPLPELIEDPGIGPCLAEEVP